MRVQLEAQSLRLRIDEAELARLLAGEAVENRTQLPDGRIDSQRLQLGPDLAWQREHDAWQLVLPATDVRALSERLPSRAGLQFAMSVPGAQALQILFDIDVRDSARKRLPRSGEAS